MEKSLDRINTKSSLKNNEGETVFGKGEKFKYREQVEITFLLKKGPAHDS